MKKNFSLVILLLALVSLSACESKEKPTPSTFKPLLVYSSPGELASVPIPFADWGATAEKVGAWEAEYGSMLQTSMESARLDYKTLDPKNDNPMRCYIMSKSGLSRVLLTVRSSLVLNKDGKSYNDQFLGLLKKDGFSKVVADANGMTYSKGELQISIDTDNVPAEMCLLSYAKYDDTPPTPVEFRPFVQFDTQGNITAIPLPYFDAKSGNAEALKIWESEYGSTPKEVGQDGIHTYRTNDPTQRNPIRVYRFNKDKPGSSSSAVVVQSKAVLKADGEFGLSEDFELLLNRNGYKLELESPEDSIITYNNGSIYLSVIGIKGIKAYVTINFMPSAKPTLFDFDPKAVDFPFLDLDPKKITEENMKAYEAKLNLRDLNPKMSSGRKYVYSSRINTATQQLTNTNLLSVTYDFTNIEAESPILKGLSIGAASLSFSSLAMLKSPEGTSYMKNNGFEFVEDISVGSLKIWKYTDKKRYWNCLVSESTVKGSPALIFVFTKLPNPVGPDVPAEAIRFFLPLIDWTAKIEEGSAIWNFEVQRGFVPKINFSEGFQTNWMFAALPMKQWPKEKNGFYSLGYYAKSKEDKTLKDVAVMVHSGYKFKIKDEDIQKFFVDNGYEFKGDAVHGPLEVRYFYNATLKAQIVMMAQTGSSSNPTINFVELDQWTEMEKSPATILSHYKRVSQRKAGR